jgi:hypothetical protein
MNSKAAAWAWEQDLKPGPKFVLIALCEFVDGNGECYPGQVRLSSMIGAPVRSVQRYLDTLVEAGIIEKRVRVRGNGSRTSNAYKLVGYEPPAALTVDKSDVPTGQSDMAGSSQVRNAHTSPGREAHDRVSSPELELELKTENHKSASPTPSVKTSLIAEGEAQELVDIWNELRGPLASVKKVTTTRRRALTRLVREAGSLDEAKRLLRLAAPVVAENDFWRQGGYGLDNLLSTDKVFRYAERAEHEARALELKADDMVSIVNVHSPRQEVIVARVLELMGDQLRVEPQSPHGPQAPMLLPRSGVRQVVE